MIELKPISILDKEMAECVHLNVTEEQYDFVAPNSVSLAEAYDLNKKGGISRAAPYAAYKDGEMSGFVMVAYFDPKDEDEDEYYCDEPYYYIWRLFVDINHQSKGYGKEILRLAMEKVKTKYMGEANWCFSCYDPDNIASKRAFAAYGFEEDGRMIDGESVCKIAI